MTIPKINIPQNDDKRHVSPENDDKEIKSARNKRIEEIKNIDFKQLQEAVIEKRKRSFTI